VIFEDLKYRRKTMQRRSAAEDGRFAEEQIIGVLNQHEIGRKAAELSRKIRLSPATIYAWKSRRQKSRERAGMRKEMVIAMEQCDLGTC
jgi:hypothetical protein